MQSRKSCQGKSGLDYYVTFAEQLEPHLFGSGQKSALEAFEAEHRNLCDVLDEACQTDPSAGIRICTAAWRFWLLRGHLAEGREKLARLLSVRGGVPPAIRARGMTVEGIVAFFQGDHGRAERCAEKSMPAASQLEDAWGVAFSTTVLGWVAQACADYVRAAALFQESLSHFRQLGHRWGEAVSLLNLGEIARSQGDDLAAEQFYRADLAIYYELGEESAMAATLCNLGYVALHRDDPAARAYFAEALEICRRLRNKQFAAGILVGFAGLASAGERWEGAAHLLRAADDLLVQVGSTLESADLIERDRILQATRRMLGESGLKEIFQESQAWTIENAMRHALTVT